MHTTARIGDCLRALVLLLCAALPVLGAEPARAAEPAPVPHPPAGAPPPAALAPRPLAVSTVKVIDGLAAQLGAEDYAIRERASAALRRIGRPALPALRRAATNDDPEVRVRADEIMRAVLYVVGPEWAADLAQAVRHHERLTEGEKLELPAQLARQIGTETLPFLAYRLCTGSEAERDAVVGALPWIEGDSAGRLGLFLVEKPGNRQEVRFRAWALERAGRPFDAYRLLARAKLPDRAPDEHTAGDGIAGLIAAGQFDRAARALALHPDDEVPHFDAARAFSAAGHRRLAIKEWKAILAMPPNESVYDINAYMGIVADCAEGGLFREAADHLADAIETLIRMRDAHHPMGVLGVEVARVRVHIDQLRREAEACRAGPDVPVEEPLPQTELTAAVRSVVKDGNGGKLAAALEDAAVVVRLTGLPEGLRLLDAAPCTLRYDAEAKRLQLLVAGVPCAPALPLDGGGRQATVAVKSDDVWHVFLVEPVSGQATPAGRWELDYVLRLVPGERLRACREPAVRINDQVHDWEDAIGAITVDRLPAAARVTVTATAPSGRRNTTHFRVALEEPPFSPSPAEEDRP